MGVCTSVRTSRGTRGTLREITRAVFREDVGWCEVVGEDGSLAWIIAGGGTSLNHAGKIRSELLGGLQPFCVGHQLLLVQRCGAIVADENQVARVAVRGVVTKFGVERPPLIRIRFEAGPEVAYYDPFGA